MKISIITATYNSEATLADTIESVVNQTYSDIEYIIVDGASSDRTMDIAREYKPKFGDRMRIISEPDKGIYDALNKGISFATGDVVGFIHADDMLASEDVIRKVADKFNSSQCDILYGDLYYVDKTNTKIIRSWKSCQYKHGMLRNGWMPPHPTLYVRKKIYDTIGGFDLDFRISADYDFILRAFGSIDEDKSVYLPMLMVRMRIGGISNNGLKNITIKVMEDIKALKKKKFKAGILVLINKNISKLHQLFVQNK